MISYLGMDDAPSFKKSERVSINVWSMKFHIMPKALSE
jgi:hypothetical protein